MGEELLRSALGLLGLLYPKTDAAGLISMNSHVELSGLHDVSRQLSRLVSVKTFDTSLAADTLSYEAMSQ